MVVFLLLYGRNPCRKASSPYKFGATFVLVRVKTKAKVGPGWRLVALILMKVALTQCMILHSS